MQIINGNNNENFFWTLLYLDLCTQLLLSLLVVKHLLRNLPGNWSFAEVATDKRCRISGCFALLSPGKTRGPIGLCCWGCPMRSKRLFWGCSGFLGGGGGGGCWAASRFCWFCCCCNCCCTVGCLCVMEGLATAPLEVSEIRNNNDFRVYEFKSF